MNNGKENVCRCEKCPHKDWYWGKGQICRNPNKEKITKYFEEHKINKMPGFIGFIKADGSFPVKRTPKWCPLEGGEQE